MPALPLRATSLSHSASRWRGATIRRQRKITVDQFLAIDHDGSEEPSALDEQTFLTLVGGGTLNLQLTTTVTDGDGDQVSSPVQVNLIGNETFVHRVR